MSAIDPNLSTEDFKAAVEARLLALVAAGDPRLKALFAANEAAGAVAHVETVLLLSRFHAQGKIAEAVANGLRIDDDFLARAIEARLPGAEDRPLAGLARQVINPN